MARRFAYWCRLCEKRFWDLGSLVLHFEREHRDLPDVQNWIAFRLHGRRYGTWRKYRDLRGSDLVLIEVVQA